jgi:hypothetical protein
MLVMRQKAKRREKYFGTQITKISLSWSCITPAPAFGNLF